MVTANVRLMMSSELTYYTFFGHVVISVWLRCIQISRKYFHLVADNDNDRAIICRKTYDDMLCRFDTIPEHDRQTELLYIHCGSKKTRQLWRTITTTQFSRF